MPLLATLLSLAALPAATVWWHDDGPLGPAFYVDAPEGRFAFALPPDADGPVTWRGSAGEVGWATLPGGQALGLAWDGGPRWLRLAISGESLRRCASRECRFGGDEGWGERPLPVSGLLPLGMEGDNLLARGSDALWLLPSDDTGSVRSLSPTEASAMAWLASSGEIILAPSPAPPTGEWFPWGMLVEVDEYRLAEGDSFLLAYSAQGTERVFSLLAQTPEESLSPGLTVATAGRTEAEAAAAFSAYSLAFHAERHSVVALGMGPYQATILGAVENPGPVVAEEPLFLQRVLAAALPRPNADLSRVEIRLSDGSWEAANMFDLLHGAPTLPILLPRGAVLFVPAGPERAVQVLGAVGHAGPVAWTAGSTVATAIAAAGGLGLTDREVALLVPANGVPRDLLLAPGHTDWGTGVAPGDALLVFHSGGKPGTEWLDHARPLLAAILSSARAQAILEAL